MNLEEYFRQAVEAGDKSLEFLKTIVEYNEDIMVPVLCTLIDAYCDARHLNPIRFSEEIAENVKGVNQQNGPIGPTYLV